ncbi:MAG TPA: PGPGW domain-containing protein [Candidatus Saccharimonadales bacterium]|nr:PGPGW domain-containing protein [Candidatus Saccharimonadales bacterium]
MRPLKSLFRKTGVTILGFGLLVAGGLLLVLPGPGIVVIILGLVVLSWEYEWAKHHLHRVRQLHKKALSKTKRNIRP